MRVQRLKMKLKNKNELTIQRSHEREPHVHNSQKRKLCERYSRYTIIKIMNEFEFVVVSLIR